MLIKKYVHGKGARLFSLTRNLDDKLEWGNPMDAEFNSEIDVDQYISKQRQFDEDLWVIEIDDPKDIYRPDNITV